MGKHDFTADLQASLLKRGTKPTATERNMEDEQKTEKPISERKTVSKSSEDKRVNKDDFGRDIVIDETTLETPAKKMGVPSNIKNEISKDEKSIDKKEVIKNITPNTEIIPAENVVKELVVVEKEPKKNVGGRPKIKTVPHEKITVDLPSNMVEMVKDYAIKEYDNNLTTYIRRLIAKDLKNNLEFYKKSAKRVEDEEWNWN